MKKNVPIQTLNLIPLLDNMLIELLNSLTPEECTAQTVANLWTVKDVASHLLDGNLRALSSSRDRFFGEKPDKIDSSQDLIGYLNKLNGSWTEATKRLSPEVIVSLLDFTGKQYSTHLQTLDPFEEAIFPVAWAGQETSPNWFHIAREYTEKFLHQQQIRDAVGKPGLMTREFFHPFMDTLMLAFPYTFRDVASPTGTCVSLCVTTTIGGLWTIVKKENEWHLEKEIEKMANSIVRIDPDTAWKLFSKSMTTDQALDKVEFYGDIELGKKALEIVAVMA
ncbi:hypothetical protein P872_13715 [Rhodonellum psychrophilum GCM71 = DSM 17998]|uniref:Mycothiol-dependent maleylpyruvate isomerase metal-binding domain-containing protein n=2 Tax=Rhodonellum TaxID=336827 RepID=U5BS77_9BACT|nr:MULTISPECIES: maleylpyruvate isomerase family mycothiol-dependent enzyme [Rhodonellum]ERM80354.1 hypothetical protein P872_13715 [Rhodonellum psychrophilum GCM71 = DSM 17998]SDZ58354.1 TIGR03083 family protein [Rhodonellum ikkaensis]